MRVIRREFRVGMASNRQVQLSAIVLAAMIVAMMGPTTVCSRAPTDDERLKQLGKPKVGTEGAIKILKSLKDKTKDIIPNFSAEVILNYAKDNILGKDNCEIVKLSSGLCGASSDDLNLVLNVYNVSARGNKQLQTFCAENIGKVFEDKEKLDQLNKKILTIRDIAEIYSSIKNKKDIILDKFSVQEIFDKAIKGGFALEDCQYDALVGHKIYRTTGCSDLETNLRNLYAASYGQLISFCAGNIIKVFDASITSEEKDELIELANYEEIRDLDQRDRFERDKRSLCDRLWVKTENVVSIVDLSQREMPGSLAASLDSFKHDLRTNCPQVGWRAEDFNLVDTDVHQIVDWWDLREFFINLDPKY